MIKDDSLEGVIMQCQEKYLFYLDEEGINKYYIDKFGENKLEIAGSEEKKFNASAGFGLSLNITPTSTILPNGNIGSGYEKVKVKEYLKNSETRLQEILKKVKKQKTYFEDLNQAIQYLNGNSGQVFINVNEKFDIPQFKSKESELDIIKSEYLIFEIGNQTNYDYSDYYYKKLGYHIFMNANICKLNNKKYSSNGHEAVIFRESLGRNILLYVVGLLSKAGDTYFIKPYAIYR